MPLRLFYISSLQKNYEMKKTFISLFAVFSLLSCGGNPFEEQAELYSTSIETMPSCNTLETIIEHCYSTETAAVGIMARYKGENLKEMLGDDYSLQLSQVENLRDSFLNIVDEEYLAYKMHFVEKRTALYAAAAEFYANAQSLAELDTIKSLTEKYSAMAFVEGQRLCDPPAAIIAAYDSVKSLSAVCYSRALERLDK